MAVILILVTVSCRTSEKSASLADGAEAIPAPEEFLQQCANWNSIDESASTIMHHLVADAFPGQGSASVLQSRSCDDVWQGIVASRTLFFSTGRAVKDLASILFLKGIPEFEITLQIARWPRNFAVLRELQLSSLRIMPAHNHSVSLTPVEVRQLLETVASIESLQLLEFKDLGLRDLSALEPLPLVKKLTIAKNPIRDLSFLSDWRYLEDLTIWKTQVEDLSPLGTVLTLRRLEALESNIVSIEPLLLLANLETVMLDHSSNLESVLALQYLPSLSNLSLQNSAVKNLEPLGDLPLVQLGLTGTPVEDLAPIASPTLRNLYVGGTKIDQIDAIRSMPALRTLNISDTAVTSFPVLPENHPLEVLVISGTRIEDDCPIFALNNLRAFRTREGQLLRRPAIRANRCAADGG